MGSFHSTLFALGGAICGADGGVAVEVGGGEQQFGWGAVGEVGNGGGGDVASPAVFDGHGNAQSGAEISRLSGFGEAAEFADFDVHYVHGRVCPAAEQDFEVVDGFVENEGMRRAAADGEAFFVAGAGLFDVDVDVADSVDDSQSLVHEPAGVGVGNQCVACF